MAISKLKVVVVNAQEYQELMKEFEEKLHAVKEVAKRISEFDLEIDVERTEIEK